MSEYTPTMVKRFQELVKAGRIRGMALMPDGQIGLDKGSIVEMKARRCAPGEKALEKGLEKHPEISNPFALAKWMLKRGKGKKRKRV
jgi:hypothetical protein